jgi:hypothetical protein
MSVIAHGRPRVAGSVFCSIEITGDGPGKSTSGFATCATNRFA